MKHTVALIYGGPSAEYEVSLNSAKAVKTHLAPEKYQVIDVRITKDGQWVIDDEKLSIDSALEKIKSVDAAFLALHGTYGEDGQLQSLLAEHGIKFTGSDAAASALAMDKVKAGEVFQRAGLRVPKTMVTSTIEEAITTSQTFQPPFVIKPVSQGSSVGVSIVRQSDQLNKALQTAFEHDERVIVQEFVSGREVSCGVLAEKDGELKALPPTELIPADADFFDYHAKYTPGATNEVTPPDMPQDTINRIQDLASQAHQALGCQGYSRTDMIVADDDIYVIETNTLPGMTETSILPQQAVAAGMTYEQLVDRLIELAL